MPFAQSSPRYGERMGIQELIYGPRQVGHVGLGLVRPTIVDMDTVRDFADRASRLLAEGEPAGIGNLSVTFSANGDLVPRENLDALSLVDRNRLTVRIQYASNSAFIEFSPVSRPAVMVVIPRSLADQERVASVLQAVIQDGNPPVLRPRRFLLLLPPTFVLLILALWIWVVVSAEVPPAVLTLGWALWAGIAGTAWWGVVQLQKYINSRDVMVGNRVRGETRAMTIARRHDARANLRLSLVTIPAGIVAGLILAFATNLFGLK